MMVLKSFVNDFFSLFFLFKQWIFACLNSEFYRKNHTDIHSFMYSIFKFFSADSRQIALDFMKTTIVLLLKKKWRKYKNLINRRVFLRSALDTFCWKIFFLEEINKKKYILAAISSIYSAEFVTRSWIKLFFFPSS